MHISIYVFSWCRNAIVHKFFSWKLCTCRFLFQGLYLYLFSTFAPLFCAYTALCAFHTYILQDHGINFDCLTSAKNIIFIIQCEAIFYYLQFIIFIFFASTPTPAHKQSKPSTTRRFISFHTNKEFYLTIIFIPKQSHFSASKDVSCRARRILFQKLYARFASYGVAYNRQDRIIMRFAIKFCSEQLGI